MLNSVVLLCAISCAWGAAVPAGMLPQLEGRIVGGKPAAIIQFPWQVSILVSGDHECGGAIYNPKIIITAAHCLLSATIRMLKIRAGASYKESGGVLMDVAAFMLHKDYDRITKVNDIALIRLNSPFTMSSVIKSINLAKISPPNGAIATVSGWGSTYYGGNSVSGLRSVDLTIIGNDYCSSSFFHYGSMIQHGMICTYSVGKDTCSGDSGGPLVSGGVLVGISSFGYLCADPKYPGVYVDVAAYNSWIVSNALTV